MQNNMVLIMKIEDFEKEFPIPDGVYWNEGDKDYSVSPFAFRDESFIRFSGAWQSWQIREKEIAQLRDTLLDLYGEGDLLLEELDMVPSNKEQEVIKELAMLVKRLSSTLKIAVPKSRLADNAMAYLKNMQLVGSPMRENKSE